jgi:hypothetical protein
MNKLIRPCLCLQVLFWTCITLPAVQPDQWTVSTSEEFLAGDLKGVSLTGEGGIVLAPSLEQVLDTGEAFIYASVMDSAGNLYLGTGSQGKIFRLGANGEGGEWARLGEAGVHALAIDSSNRLYAASSPDGKVFRFDGNASPQSFFDPDEKYIWSLAVDSRNNLYVGTGPQGNIYKVDPQGRSEVFYNSKESHVVTLKLSPDGQLLAGTSPGGLLLRFAADGKPFVLFDSPLDEIKSIAVDRLGNIYAAALEGGSTAAAVAAVLGEASETAARKGTRAAGSADNEAEQVTVEVVSTAKGKRSEVYRIDKNNLVETVYSSSDGVPYDLLVRADGNVLLATSNKGRIISIDSNRLVTYLLQTPEEQVTQLQERGGRLYAATSNLGKVFIIGGKPASSASYESKVFDAGTTAKWGVIRWRARGSSLEGVRMFTRSGNTATADQTWGGWDGPYAEGGSSPIKSAAARFIQWKVEFPEKTAALSPAQAEGIDLVTIAYLQENLPPQVRSLTVHPPGVAFADFPGASQGGISPGGPDRSHFLSLPRAVRELDRPPAAVPPRKIYYPGARSLSWTASDPNRDALVYSVWLRRQGETNWLLIKDDLQETNYTIDGASFPSGTYFARVIASDRLSNPPGRALDARISSKAFVIANSSPVIEIAQAQVQGSALTLPFAAKTQASTVHQVDYSVDGGTWQMLFPDDGIADTEDERYTLRLDKLAAGEHEVRIRAVDSVGNVSTAKTTITVPGS